jgi:hypothetical protein
MTKPVRVTIRGPEDDRVDAPTVDDLLGQIKDIVDVLRGVEKNVEANGATELVWRVTDATMNSPISLELTPYGAGPAALIAARIERVERATLDGFKALRRGEARPPYFSEDILYKARKIHARVLNGLSDTVIAFADEIDPIVIDRPAARDLERTSERAKAVGSAPYRELGSVEGFVTKPELDGYDRAILRFRSRMDATEIKAYASGAAFRQIEELKLSDVWHGVRVRVYGTINYKALGIIDFMNATAIEVLDEQHLPGIDDIIDVHFTGGLTTEEFLRELRADD